MIREYDTGCGNSGRHQNEPSAPVKSTYRNDEASVHVPQGCPLRWKILYDGHMNAPEFSQVADLRRAHRGCLQRRWTSQTRRISHLASLHDCVDDSWNRRNRDLGTAIHIVRRLTTALQGKERPAYIKPHTRKFNRNQCQSKLAEAVVDDRAKRSHTWSIRPS